MLGKGQFVLDRELCTCAEGSLVPRLFQEPGYEASAEGYLMYVYTTEHHFVYQSSSCPCTEGCLVYVLSLKCQFTHFPEVQEYAQ